VASYFKEHRQYMDMDTTVIEAYLSDVQKIVDVSSSYF